MHCLLVDDDIPTVHVLRDFINWEALGITRVSAVHNIHDAKTYFNQDVPDIVICDIEMPSGSGIDMIKWVRGQKHACSFIYFTCHENFEFASTAISYDADAYVVKPFDKVKLESTLLKAVEAIRKQKEVDTYSLYGQSWLKNRDLVEQGFWRDVLSATIAPRPDMIHAELGKRGLEVNQAERFVLALCTISKTDMDIVWNDTNFKYALHNLSSEIMFGVTDAARVVTYQMDGVFYSACILTPVHLDQIRDQGQALIEKCRGLFRCVATCYIGEEASISSLAELKGKLEERDKHNLIHRGRVLDGREPDKQGTPIVYSLDAALLNDWFIQGERVKIVNFLKGELETLSAHRRLDLQTMRAIQRDFVQIAYAQLYKNNIQAHRLFSDEVSEQLDSNADSSVFQFMKWAAFVTNRTIDYLKQVIQSEGVVDKAKRFIHEHYDQELSREEIAAIVYLTPDYLAKRFKAETGMSIIEYINDYRIHIAKERLVQSHDSISQIASETGFDSVSYFSTVFKKITGETPNAYRAKQRTNPNE